MFVATVNRYASHVVVKKDVLQRAGVDHTSPDMDRAKALKGLRLGTTGPGAAPDALFRYLADMAGLDPNRDMTLTPVQGGGPGMIAGLQQGAIDGFCLSSPTSDIAIQTQGCAYLFQMVQNPPESLREYQYIIASSAERTIGEKRDALVRYAKGIALALRSIRTEPARFSDWSAKWFEGIDPAIFATVVENNRGIFFENPTPRRDLYERNLSFIGRVNKMMGADALPASLSFDTMVDPTIAAEAMQGL
jgi:NitT/TauT family transport system substrate-binding protein